MLKYNEEDFLKKVLGIPSVNGTKGERALAVFLRNFLQECGINAVLQEIDGKHANVVAVLEGKTKDPIIWNGHLDTVPYGNLHGWNTDPAEPVKKNGYYYVRGASDMKSGLAGMAWTLGYMNKKGRVPKHTIYFCATCDEEQSGMGARYFLESEILKKPSLILIGEPTALQLGVAQKGCIWLQFNIYGKTSHGAYPEEGINAIEYGFLILQKLKKKIENNNHLLLGRSTAQISMVKGGIACNMTPDEAEFIMDIRVIPGLTLQQILNWAKEVSESFIQELGEVFKVDIQVKNNRRAIETSANHFWVKKLGRELKYQGLSEELIGISYFTDASILTGDENDIPVLLFGPGDPRSAHKCNECLKLENYSKYVRVLQKIY